MGYFSNLMIDYEDNSYPGPDRQALWRLEELECKLADLLENGENPQYKDDGLRLTDDEIRFAIPEDLNRIVDIDRAIDIAIKDLRTEHGIFAVRKDDAAQIYVSNILSAGQMCFDESWFAETHDKLLKAA